MREQKMTKTERKQEIRGKGWFSSTCTALLPLGMSVCLTDLQVTVKAKHSV